MCRQCVSWTIQDTVLECASTWMLWQWSWRCRWHSSQQLFLLPLLAYSCSTLWSCRQTSRGWRPRACNSRRSWFVSKGQDKKGHRTIMLLDLVWKQQPQFVLDQCCICKRRWEEVGEPGENMGRPCKNTISEPSRREAIELTPAPRCRPQWFPLSSKFLSRVHIRSTLSSREGRRSV